ncbi:MAG: GGDEF domain-containing protein [Alphaproteobacteria bacterium]|nr:GGDEF domain-containing protein [Alphaproteobacteria bacterium]
MMETYLRAGFVSVAITMVTTFVVLATIPLMGEKPAPSAYYLMTILPFLVSFPLLSYLIHKADQAAELNKNLQAAYRELAALHAQLTEKSRKDDMTGVLNRTAFLEHIESLKEDQQQGTLLMIDADHFKQINDRFGHLIGDEALIVIAQTISAAVRSNDVVGRLGGEEFGVFLKGARKSDARAISERIRASINALEFKPTAENRHTLTVSIGGVTTKKANDWKRVLQHADAGLYEAKKQGRNRVVLLAA